LEDFTVVLVNNKFSSNVRRSLLVTHFGIFEPARFSYKIVTN